MSVYLFKGSEMERQRRKWRQHVCSLAVCFKKGHEQARRDVRSFFGHGFTASQCNQVITESEELCDEVNTWMEGNVTARTLQVVETQMVAVKICNKEMEFIQLCHQWGIIDENEDEELREEVSEEYESIKAAGHEPSIAEDYFVKMSAVVMNNELVADTIRLAGTGVVSGAQIATTAAGAAVAGGVGVTVGAAKGAANVAGAVVSGAGNMTGKATDMVKKRVGGSSFKTKSPVGPNTDGKKAKKGYARLYR